MAKPPEVEKVSRQRDNNLAILIKKRNCESEVIDTIGPIRNTHDVYKELKAERQLPIYPH